ncbi:HAD-IIIC family phosphatase [Streptomyces argyrophyllae]|uniref:HAD-IIIC family phosphatase n=1 Tax=Streptomyces argyrophylli TaxID=2726118 RepID=A0A6M4PG63_9ACTN|nr:HAD-IIIC family phosphatase [Streptomyces argyrophyllae]QJS09494.1 HAD-IIIC family phosphatase [Streptomyces argyrophyllae]
MTGSPPAPASLPGDDLLNRIRALRDSPAATDTGLGRELGAVADPLLLHEAGRLLEGVAAARLTRAPATRATTLRVAVAATFTADDVVPLLRAALLAGGVDAELHLCPYDQLGVQLTDPASALAEFAPEVTLCLMDAGALLPRDWDPSALDGVRTAVRDRVDAHTAAAAGFAARTGSAVLLHTVPLPRLDRRSVISFRGGAALGRIWREANIALLAAGETRDGVYTVDLEALFADEPGPVRDERQYRFGRMAWTPAAQLAYAREAAAFCRAAAGLGRKVLVLDLDNTLWGGVLGDDGPAGIELGTVYPGDCYTDLQRRALALRRQGVLLAVCSKNERALVEETLAGHPDMVLRPDDFVAVVADWQRKDLHVAALAEELALGLDAFVFADDSPFECGMVAGSLPQVDVVALDGDPACHSTRLLEPARFAQLGVTATDAERTALYRGRRERHRLSTTHETAEEYLRALGIHVTVGPADAYTLPRLVQLEQRTNQFNMTGRAHGEALTRRLAGDPGHLVLAVEVTDRFGGEGVVGGVWLDRGPDRWTVRNLVLSCRVLGRGVERAVLQYVADTARAAGAAALETRFRPTARNAPAATLYPSAGFTRAEGPAGDDGTVHHEARLDRLPALTPDWITLVAKEAPAHV